jgi:ferredoxin/flavodoxin
MKKAMFVYFSPTHTTKKVLQEIAIGLDLDEIIECDLTLPNNKEIVFDDIDLVVVGAPVYSGRVPVQAMERFKRIPNAKIPAVCVSLYGNISFGDALKELNQMMKSKEFITIAGAGFIGEHSFSNDRHQIAKGRPNSKDLELAREFGVKIKNKLMLNSIDDLASEGFDVPGKVPTKKASSMPEMASRATRNCIKCMKCIGVCPVGAINEQLVCDANKCITCFACVKECPSNARKFQNPILSVAGFILSKKQYKEPEIFI